MKVVILAGGLGTRISEETSVKPKPMVEIGGKPILWHVMKIYSSYGFKEFIICLGYKGYCIKEWFSQYYLHNSDVTFDLEKNKVSYYKHRGEGWKVTLVDTGNETMTGGRIKRIKDYVNKETFMMTYGDGVGNVNLKKLIDAHKKHGKLATVTASLPEGRFGVLKIEKDNQVSKFSEKTDYQTWVNSGFFVLEPGVFEYIEGDKTPFEQKPLETLAKNRQLYAFQHVGFWKPMDTLSDKQKLEELWQSDKAPWKIWGDK